MYLDSIYKYSYKFRVHVEISSLKMEIVGNCSEFESPLNATSELLLHCPLYQLAHIVRPPGHYPCTMDPNEEFKRMRAGIEWMEWI